MQPFVEAARPRTLPAAVAPVLVGTATAAQVSAWRAGAALVVALALQVAVNYANDYSDGVRGVDTPDRAGPRRAVAAGLVTPGAMKRAIGLALAVAAVAGLALAAVVSWELIAVGALCVAAALGYSGGPRPYASAALGEVFVFVFFGLVATVGSAYVQTGRLTLLALAAALPVGLLAVALLVVNNLRDIPTDAAAGKRTLAVRLGDETTRKVFDTVLVLPFVLLGFVSAAGGSGWVFLPWLAIPLTIPATRAVRRRVVGRDLVVVLEGTARVQLAFAVLLAAGLRLGQA